MPCRIRMHVIILKHHCWMVSSFSYKSLISDYRLIALAPRRRTGIMYIPWIGRVWFPAGCWSSRSLVCSLLMHILEMMMRRQRRLISQVRCHNIGLDVRTDLWEPICTSCTSVPASTYCRCAIQCWAWVHCSRGFSWPSWILVHVSKMTEPGSHILSRRLSSAAASSPCLVGWEQSIEVSDDFVITNGESSIHFKSV